MLNILQKTAKTNIVQAEGFWRIGHYPLAEQKFREAIVIYTVYNLPERNSEVYYRVAQMHMEMGRYDVAFEDCSYSLDLHKSAKVI